MPVTPAPETSEDEFLWDNWLELIAKSDPAGADVISIDGSEATIIGEIPANKVRSAIAFFLGHSWCEVSGGSPGDTGYERKLRRRLPAAHPVYSWLYVKSLQVHRRNPSVHPTGGEPSVPSIDPSVYEKTGFYQSAWLTLHFAPRPYDLYEDADTDYEFERFTQIYKTAEPMIDTISCQTGRHLTFTEGDPASKTFPGEVTEYRISTGLVVAWENVPLEFVADDYGFYTKIIRALGRVNDDVFFGCPRGTLRMDPPRIRKYVQPVRAEDDEGEKARLFAVDIEFVFAHTDPPPAVGYPDAQGNGGSAGRGWQLMPWAEGGNVDTDVGGVGWYHVSRPDGTDFLPYYDFYELFTGHDT